jgi:hypothetical protein
MAKTDKSTAQEIPIVEAPAIIQELAAGQAEEAAAQAEEAPAQTEETFEQREERLRREEYERRNLEAIASREEILRRNGVLKPDEPFSMDPEAAVNLRCCPR